MREENFGPVTNADGTPSEMTKQMLLGTGRYCIHDSYQAGHCAEMVCYNYINKCSHHSGRAPHSLCSHMLMETGPAIEEFDPDEWKLLAMLLCENRGKHDLNYGLTEHGQQLLHSVQRKIGIRVLGVDMDADAYERDIT